MKPLAALLGAGALLRLALALRTPVINTDAMAFLDIAAGFLAGDPSAATAKYYHPVYPALIAVGGGSEAVGIAISILAGALAGWPLWVLARDLADERAAFIAVALVQLHPALVDTQSDVFADGLFLLAAAGAVCGAVRYVVHGRGLWLAAVAAGAGWLMKSEGLIVALLAALTAGTGVVRRREWGKGAIAAVIAIAIVGPYVLHLSRAGRLQVSPKPSAGAVLEGEGEEAGAGHWATRREKCGAFVGSVWYFAYQGARAFTWGHLLALAAAALTVRRWGARMSGKGWILGWVLFFLFCVWWPNYSTAHQVSQRYLNPPVAFSMVFLGPFAAWALDRLGERRALRAAVLAAAALLAIGAPTRSIVLGRRAEQLGLRKAGEWILAERGPGAGVATSSDKPVYYAKAKLLPMKFPPAPEAQFVVISEREAAKQGWDLAALELAAFVKVKSFDEPPKVHIYERRR